MKNQITFLILFVVLCFSSPRAQVTQEWVTTYNGGAGYIFDIANAVAVGNSGNVYVTGVAESFQNSYGATIKYSSSGVQQWAQRYIEPGNASYSGFNSMVIDSFENVYVAGSTGETSFDFVTIKYNLSGDSLWVARYNGPGNGNDGASSIAVDGSGNVYVTGVSEVGGNSDYATVKYNSSGVQQWVARYNGLGNGYDRAISIKVDGSGNVYVTGFSAGGSTGDDYATIKYNSSGDSLWVARYGGTGDDRPWGGLAIDGSGNVYVTGQSQSDYATIKYNLSGIQQWVQRYSGQAISIAVDASGNVYVTGNSSGGGTSIDYATIKYNTSGDSLWVARYNGLGNSNRASSIKVDSYGNVYVTGYIQVTGTVFDFATIKYNSSGLQQWVQRYNGSGQSTPMDLALDISGNVYVTGSSGVGSLDFLTIKYSQPTGFQNISSETPNEYSLSQNYPNPFNPITALRYSLIENRFVKLIVYDVLGNEVATLVNEKQNAGSYSIDFDGSNLSSGIYFYKLLTDNFSEVKKMTLIK